MLQTNDIKKLSESWCVLGLKKPVYYTYIELLKLVESEQISLSTHVTRREGDVIGIPIGGLKDFYPATASQLCEKLSPPHTKLNKIRSFRRIHNASDCFIRFQNGFKVKGKLGSIGAGGLSLKLDKNFDLTKIDFNLSVTIPNLNGLSDLPVTYKCEVVSTKRENDRSLSLNLKFKDLCSKKKVDLNKRIEEQNSGGYSFS